MIGLGLRKLAKEYGMKIKEEENTAYGSVEGMAVTLHKSFDDTVGVTIACVFESEEQMMRFSESIDNEIIKNNRAHYFTIELDEISMSFDNKLRNISKMRIVLNYLLEQLKNSQVLGADYCNYCKRFINGNGTWKLINTVAYHLHPECVEAQVEAIRREILAEPDDEDDEPEDGEIEVVDLE